MWLLSPPLKCQPARPSASPEGTEQVTESGSAVFYIYTDGSGDPVSGRTGSATGETRFLRRTTDLYSISQTELVALLLALEHAQDRPEITVAVHTDSRTGMKTL